MKDPTRFPPARTFLRFFLPILLTGVLTWVILEAVGLSLEEVAALDPAEWRPQWVPLVAASLLLLMVYLFGAGLWGRMVKELGGPPVRFIASCRVFFTANLGRYLPGKVWQVAGLAYLAKGERVPASTAVTAALLGQALALAGATLVGMKALLQGGWGMDLGRGWVAAGLVLMMTLLMMPAVLRSVLKAWLRLARGAMPEGWSPHPSFGLRWVALYGLGWVGQGWAFCILAQSLGLELDPVLGIPAYAAAYLLGYLMLPAPAGLGIREGFLILFLEPALGAGVAPLAIVARLWTTLVELVPAMILAGGYLKSFGRGEGRSA